MGTNRISGKIGSIVGSVFFIFICYLVAAALHMSLFGGFVVVMVGGAVLIYSVIGIHERFFERVSDRSLARLKIRTISACHDRFKYTWVVDQITKSIENPGPETLTGVLFSWCSKNFALTDVEYDVGIDRGYFKGKGPTWAEAFHSLHAAVETSKPEYKKHFSEIERSHRALLTFYGQLPEFQLANSMSNDLGYFSNLEKNNPQRYKALHEEIIESWPRFLEEYGAYNSAWNGFLSMMKGRG
jgi:hypothetical protein